MASEAAKAAEAVRPTEVASSLELSVWKWVIIIGVGAVVIFFFIRKFSEIVVKKKTELMIQQVVGDDAQVDDGGDWQDPDVTDSDSENRG